jgi:HEAT repeat protein
LLLGLGLLSACESVSSENIEQWKGTQKGPPKIEEALRSSGVAPGLRAEAAAALGDLGMPEKVDEVMAALPADQRWEILKSLVPIHIKAMESAPVPKARDARDGLFSVRGYAQSEERQRIDAAILTSMEKDLKDGRFVGGRHSLDKMLTAIGAPSGPMLVRLLQDPKAPYKGLAELLLKVGDESARDEGGAALVRRAAAFDKMLTAIGTPSGPMLVKRRQDPKAPYKGLAELPPKVGDESARDQGGAALVRRAAAEKEIPNDLWIAMGTLGGQNVTDFLTQKLLKGPPAQAALAAKALQQARYPSVLPLALKIAADPKANNLVRDEAFGVVEKIAGPAAQKGLVEIIASDKKDLVRYRAYEAALEAGKVEAVLPALQAFSDKLSFKKEDVADFLVKDISKLGLPAKPAVLSALASPSALARITAVWALEAPLANPRQSLGTAGDVTALLKLANDKASPKGFPASVTVGSEAKRVAAVLQKRGS